MSSSHNNAHSEAAKMEQIITEFLAKSLHIILESRSTYVSSRNFSGEQIVSSPSSSSSSSSSVRPRDKWFNLALRECPAALENLDLWHQSNSDPIVVDVVLVQRPVGWDNLSPRRELVRNLSSKERYPYCCNSDQEDFCYEAKSEKIIERWVVHYESRKIRDGNLGPGSRRSSNTLSTLYKKSILLLRSLYATVRLLPAYKIFRDLNSSGQIRSCTLSHRVSSFVEPFTRKEEAEMQRFGFTPVDTSCGRLCLSVLYRSSLSEMGSEPSTPMSPQFIPDYVGSPLIDPLKRFPSLPVPHGSPSSLPFSRRHSWSFDPFKASPPSISFSPSPTRSEPHAPVFNPEPHAPVFNPSSRRYPPVSLPPHQHETSLTHKQNTGFDECYPTPAFSSNPSSSSPIHIPGSNPSKSLLRSESAPVPIPTAKHAYSRTLFNKQNLPPSPPLKIITSDISKNDENMGPTLSGATSDKFFLGKDDSRKYSGVKLSSNSSPRISFSRSSSRSFQDDYDDPEFPCPFDVEDDDITDPGSRPESFDKKGNQCEQLEPGGLFPIKKSQDAAVGALVRLLKKAPPLRQDFSRLINLSEASKPETRSNSIQVHNQISGAVAVQHTSSSVASSGLFASKTTAEALEELRGYKEMKSLLISQSCKSYTSANCAFAAEP
ncbi:ATG13 domain-containing protein [Cephalotus follicularis]|uniref:ATG13 domain-containing protein n=1 Tax=Cephalotus follicularis TaxID=3775 RepID=A0A1Q3C524_CEPFO|nr:ATG13 domain-containing protein [Cephalotus follicularis]